MDPLIDVSLGGSPTNLPSSNDSLPPLPSPPSASEPDLTSLVAQTSDGVNNMDASQLFAPSPTLDQSPLSAAVAELNSAGPMDFTTELLPVPIPAGNESTAPQPASNSSTAPAPVETVEDLLLKRKLQNELRRLSSKSPPWRVRQRGLTPEAVEVPVLPVLPDPTSPLAPGVGKPAPRQRKPSLLMKEKQRLEEEERAEKREQKEAEAVEKLLAATRPARRPKRQRSLTPPMEGEEGEEQQQQQQQQQQFDENGNLIIVEGQEQPRHSEDDIALVAALATGHHGGEVPSGATSATGDGNQMDYRPEDTYMAVPITNTTIVHGEEKELIVPKSKSKRYSNEPRQPKIPHALIIYHEVDKQSSSYFMTPQHGLNHDELQLLRTLHGVGATKNAVGQLAFERLLRKSSVKACLGSPLEFGKQYVMEDLRLSANALSESTQSQRARRQRTGRGFHNMWVDKWISEVFDVSFITDERVANMPYFQHQSSQSQPVQTTATAVIPVNNFLTYPALHPNHPANHPPQQAQTVQTLPAMSVTAGSVSIQAPPPPGATTPAKNLLSRSILPGYGPALTPGAPTTATTVALSPGMIPTGIVTASLQTPTTAMATPVQVQVHGATVATMAAPHGIVLQYPMVAAPMAVTATTTTTAAAPKRSGAKRAKKSTTVAAVPVSAMLPVNLPHVAASPNAANAYVHQASVVTAAAASPSPENPHVAFLMQYQQQPLQQHHDPNQPMFAQQVHPPPAIPSSPSASLQGPTTTQYDVEMAIREAEAALEQ